MASTTRNINERDHLCSQLEAAAQVAAEKHYPDRERGGCACGFCAYSVAHVLIESIREAWDVTQPTTRAS